MGTLNDDYLLVPAVHALTPMELVIVLGAGYPAAVALDNVCFTRTAREHAGKPIYHGHTECGAPCQVLWSPDLGWAFVQLTQVDRCTYDSLHGVLGVASTVADLGDAMVLRLDDAASTCPS